MRSTPMPRPGPRQPVPGPPVAEPGEPPPGFVPLAPGQRLQALPAQHAVCIGVLAPAGPQLGELLLVLLRPPNWLCLDARGDAVGYALVERTDHPRIIAGQMPCPGQQCGD